MARSGPLLTLTAGGALAAVLLVASMNAAGGGGGDGGGELVAGQAPPGEAPTGAPTPTPTPTQAPTGAPEAERPEPVPYVGWVDGDDPAASLAIIVAGDEATAYVCDGDTVEAWLRGDADGGELRLTGDAGELRGTFDDAGATGEISVGELDLTFTIDLVEPPAGLYAAADTIRGAEVEGSWIVLEDGTQVGFTYVDGEAVPAAEIDLRLRKVEIEGRRLPVEPVTGWDE